MFFEDARQFGFTPPLLIPFHFKDSILIFKRQLSERAGLGLGSGFWEVGFESLLVNTPW